MMIAMHRLRLLTAAALISSAAVAAGAMAQQNPPPAKTAPQKKPPAKKVPAKAPAKPVPADPGAGTAQRFDDWRLGCERRPGTERETCFVEQRVGHKDAPERLALAVAIGFFAPGGKPAMIIKVPPAVVQEAGIIIKVDDQQVREVGIRQCGPENCSVMALVGDDLLAEMRAGKEAIVAYSRKESAEIVRVPVSLRGLTRGLAALQKR